MKFWRLKAAIFAALLLAPGWALAGNNADGKFNNIIGNTLVVGGDTVTLGGNLTTNGALNFSGAGTFILPPAGTLLSSTTGATAGANSNITSLSGLTTPLSAPQGGLGAASLTGFLYGNGTGAATASTTIPSSALTWGASTNITAGIFNTVIYPQYENASAGTGNDDSAAINAAIAQAANSTAGPTAGEVDFPYPSSGYYNVCAKPVLFPNSTVSQTGVTVTLNGIAGTNIRVLPTCSPLIVGDTIVVPGGTNETISSFGTATGGAGTYNVSVSQTIASEPMEALTNTGGLTADQQTKFAIDSASQTGTVLTIAHGPVDANDPSGTSGVAPESVVYQNNHGTQSPFTRNRRVITNITFDGWCMAFHDIDLATLPSNFQMWGVVARNVAQGPAQTGGALGIGSGAGSRNLDGGSNILLESGTQATISATNAENMNDAGHECYPSNSVQPYYNFNTYATDSNFQITAVDAYIAHFVVSNGGDDRFLGSHGWGYFAGQEPNYGIDQRAQYAFLAYGGADFSDTEADQPTVAGWYLNGLNGGNASSAFVANGFLINNGTDHLPTYGVLLASGVQQVTVTGLHSGGLSTAANKVFQQGTAATGTAASYAYANPGASYDTGPPPMGALTVTGNSYLGGASGAETLLVNPNVSGGDYITLSGAAAGSGVTFASNTSAGASNITFAPAGTGLVQVASVFQNSAAAYLGGYSGSESVKAEAGTTGGDYLDFAGGTTGAGVTIYSKSSSSNSNITLDPQGGGVTQLVGVLQNSGIAYFGGYNGAESAKIELGATGGDYLDLNGNALGGGATLSVKGPSGNGTLYLASLGGGAILSQINGVTELTVNGAAITAALPIALAPYVVTGLPTCNNFLAGYWAYVTDAISPAYNGTLTGGGTVKIPVFCNGSAWTAH